MSLNTMRTALTLQLQGDYEFYEELAKLFLENLDEGLPRMDQMIQAGEASSFFYWLQGSARVLGASEMVNAAALAHEGLQHGQLDVVQGQVAELLSLRAQLIVDLRIL